MSGEASKRGRYSANVVFTNTAGERVRVCPNCGKERLVPDDWVTLKRPGGKAILSTQCRACEAVRVKSYRDGCDQDELRRKEADRQRERRRRIRAEAAPKEDEPSKMRLAVYLPEPLLDAVDAEMERRGVGRSVLLREIIEAWASTSSDTRMMTQPAGRKDGG